MTVWHRGLDQTTVHLIIPSHDREGGKDERTRERIETKLRSRESESRLRRGGRERGERNRKILVREGLMKALKKRKKKKGKDKG